MDKINVKAALIISTLFEDNDKGNGASFASYAIKTLADNDIVLVSATVYDDMADMCGPAMDDIYCPDLCEHTYHDDDE